MPDYSVAFANIQSVVNRLEEPLRSELAEVARDLQRELDTDLQDLQDEVQNCTSRMNLLGSSLECVQNAKLDLGKKLTDLEHERDRQVRDLESKISDLERDKSDLEYKLRQAENEAYRARNPY